MVKRFDVFLASLDPTVGSEIRKTRPCVVVSPDELNTQIATVIVAPLTTGSQNYPTRVPCEFQEREGHIALDQIRAINKRRLLRNMGSITLSEQRSVLAVLGKLFAE